MFSESWRSIIEAGGEVQVCWIAFTSDGRQDKNWMFQLGKACAIMRALHHSIALKLELSRKAKLLMFKSIFVPFFTYGIESWVTTERRRLQMQASEIRFLRKIKRFRHLTNLTLQFQNLSISSGFWIGRFQLLGSLVM